MRPLTVSIVRLLYAGTSPLHQDATGSDTAPIESVSSRLADLPDVTGCLIVSSGRFAGVLEGERAAVEATMERIRRDLPHEGAATLEEEVHHGPGARLFPRWSIGYAGRSLFVAAMIDRASRGDGDEVRRLMRTIVEFGGGVAA